jgi:DNA-directed RNA polymerase subunit RPC12/RpoP/ssDNA-binding Zn-finger/Zn-ribbon topoisomerase 1
VLIIISTLGCVKMFSCKKCQEPLYILNADMQDHILTLETQCMNGHKSARRLAEHQIQDVGPEIFKKIFICTECGSNMTLIDTIVQGTKTEGIFLCPRHGIQRRDFPREFLSTIQLVAADVDSPSAIIDSFRCSQCGLVYAISEIEQRRGILEVDVRCANGHKASRYLPGDLESSFLKRILQRVVHCDKCGLPGHISNIEERGNSARVYSACPVHGVTKKDLPASLLDSLSEAVSEIPEDAVLRATLTAHECRQPLAIRSIEDDKSGYKLKCVCPGTKLVTDRALPLTWNDAVANRITTAMLTCDECGHLTHILNKRKSAKKVSFQIVCPIHGVMLREATPSIFDIISDHEPSIDRLPSIVRSLSCEKCNMPLSLRDVEERRGLVEFEVECRNGHRSKRLFKPELETETLVDLYKRFFQCPDCYEPLDLVYVEPGVREDRVVQLCPIHGKYVLDIPPDHAKAMQRAYDEIKSDKAKPPVEVSEPESPETLEVEVESIDSTDGDVKVMRGCEIVGGKFDYKVKVVNDSGYVITNVTVNIVAFPIDCMELAGESVKSISRIEVGGFRSPQFTFYPTKDCVQGKVVAAVSYIDFLDQLHTMSVEPYLIRSVCDLLTPSKKTSTEFNLLLTSLEKTQQEQTLDWNAKILFTKAEKILPTKNFHVVDTEEHVIAGEFIGTLRGYAEGKYTKKKIAVVLLITGPENGRHAVVQLEALGEDVSMLPTTIDELADTMDSWVCLRCGAPLETDQVEEMGKRLPIRCKYCTHTLTIALYLQ